jgi:hypothetical protein
MMMKEEVYARLADARSLIDADNLDEARRLLRAVQAEAGYDPTAYADIVSLLMLARLYDDAEQVHMDYQMATGRELRADFTLGDIRAERQSAARRDDGGRIAFTRLTLLQRGHFSNYFTLRPVTAIEISDLAITLCRRKKCWSFPWDEVQISIDVRDAAKAVGRAFGRYVRKTCAIKAGGQTFRFDVSDQYPDFSPPRVLLSELSRRTEVTYRARDSPSQAW